MIELEKRVSLEQENKQRAEAFFAALSEGDLPTILSMYDQEGTCWTSGQTLISGTLNLEQIRAGAGAILEAFPKGLTFTIKAMTAEGERVAVEAESHGEHISGVTYHNLYHFLMLFKNGKLMQLREYMDTELVTEILCGGQRP